MFSGGRSGPKKETFSLGEKEELKRTCPVSPSQTPTDIVRSLENLNKEVEAG